MRGISKIRRSGAVHDAAGTVTNFRPVRCSCRPPLPPLQATTSYSEHRASHYRGYEALAELVRPVATAAGHDLLQMNIVPATAAATRPSLNSCAWRAHPAGRASTLHSAPLQFPSVILKSFGFSKWQSFTGAAAHGPSRCRPS